MRGNNIQKKVAGAALVSAMAFGASAAHAELSGNIGVYSKYVLRGITAAAENSNTAVQGGLDYAHDSGFYAGWWASNLDYTYYSDPVDDPVSSGFENDFYVGFAPSFGDYGFDVGVIQYYYIGVDDSDLTEAVLAFNFLDGYVQAQYLINDGFWGNSGDIYWTAGYAFALPADFSLAVDIGYYTYDDDDNDELGGVTLQDSGFRHANLTLSHPIGSTGADMAVTYIFGGEDRAEQEQGDTMVLSVSYKFGII
ncbi:MAG: TorF family putative porin [Pseudomonadota bacterium]|nr:TorF family putative porin [Pseudomonadota bacterium]